MLLELHVRDLALVDDVWVEFGPGMTALTGETGAGKTVLVGALKLLLGERADATLVRTGAPEAVVEGRFDLDGREVIVRRRVSAEGRSRCTVDDEMVTVGGLATLLGPHVDLHGQHDHQSLLVAAAHAGYLDRFAGAEATRALDDYRAAHGAFRDVSEKVAVLEEALADRERQADYLRFQVTDIDGVAPRLDEDVELESMLPRLRFGERLTAAAAGAFQALRADGGASDALAEALGALTAASGLDPHFDSLRERLLALSEQTETLASGMRDYVESVDHDPRALDETESRLSALMTLKKKYGPTLTDVLDKREEAARRLAALEAGEEGLALAKEQVAEAAELLRTAGAELTRVRDAVTGPFEQALAGSARELALPSAIFVVSREQLPFEAWNEDGPERVEFLFASAGGETPRPLGRIASGGELSRVMLALKGVLGSADMVPVLVFDEVDAGIGGATATAVGERLATLATGRQVLVVTHLAQVAAYADRQLVVFKAESEGRTVTRTHEVEGAARAEEIARMLSGDVSQVSLAHAGELLGRVSTR